MESPEVSVCDFLAQIGVQDKQNLLKLPQQIGLMKLRRRHNNSTDD
jgi:hypothetical protein